MSKHTQGKWEIEELNIYAFNKSGHNRFSCCIQKGCRCDQCMTTPISELEANARLIASAPELLAVCKWAEKALDFNQYEKGTIGYNIHQAMLQAIAKAEGLK